jgi:cobalt-zinc-cadmium efflux system outer membrane protein
MSPSRAAGPRRSRGAGPSGGGRAHAGAGARAGAGAGARRRRGRALATLAAAAAATALAGVGPSSTPGRLPGGFARAEAAPLVPTNVRGRGVHFPEYLTLVGRANLDLAAERANVPIAVAQIALAKVFPDPALTAGLAAIDVSNQGAPTASSVGVSGTIELGGKRAARVAVAEAGAAGASTALEDFLRGLRATAANAFIDSLGTRLVLDRKRLTLDRLERLVGVNEQRLRAGDIGEAALTQSRVEAQRFRGEVVLAEAEVRVADLALRAEVGTMGGSGASAAASGAPPAASGAAAGPGQALTPVGDLALPARHFDVEALIADAKVRRPDVRARQLALEAARAHIRLAHANRWVDLGVNLGWQHSAAGTGGFAQPAFDALSALFTVPIPFSHVYRGELDAAQAGEIQAAVQVKGAELRVEVDVRQALERYGASLEQIQIYTGSLLTDSEKVLDSILYNYQRGGATLLEVLEAQRTANEVFLAYYDALTNHARALVALEQAAGIWDITF